MSLSFKEQVTQLPNSTVFTIGNVSLNETEILLLERGLSFVPVLPGTADENDNEIAEFARPVNKLITSLIKKAQDEDPTFHIRAALKPRATAATSTGPAGFEFTDKLVHAISEQHKLAPKNPPMANMKPEELNALEKLQKNRAVVIKPVDKNLGVAVIEKKLYLKLALDQHLNDTATYCKLDHDPLAATIVTVNNTLDNLHTAFNITTAVNKRLRARADSYLLRAAQTAQR